MKNEIPKGLYCYELIDVSDINHIKIKLCPHWSLRKDRPSQENGHCSYLGYGDWEVEGISLLWDQCKECGVNIDD